MTFIEEQIINNEIIEKRLHPLTLLYRVFVALPSIALPLYFAFSQGSIENWFFIGLSILALLFTVPFAILHYYFFDFSITTREISIQSGIFSRKQRNIPIKRIQNINIEQNFLQRILGISKVTFETAGNKELEGQLEFISKSDALSLKNIIQNFQTNLEKNNANIEDPALNEDQKKENKAKDNQNILYKITMNEIIFHGISRFRPVLLVVFFWIFSLAQQFYFLPQINDLNTESLQSIEEMLMNENIGIVISLTILFALFGTWLLDIILTFNQFYGFKLSDSRGKLITDYGLLTKRHTTIPLKKLQSLTILTNPLKKKFDYFGLVIQTAGYGAMKGGSADIAIPIAKKNALFEITRYIRKFEIPSEFNQVSKKTIRRASIRGFVYFAILLTGLYFLYSQLLWLSVLMPLIFLHSILRWKFMGYCIEDENVIIKYGYFRQKITVIPIRKIQTLSMTANFFQRRLNLASIIVDTASHSTVGYLTTNVITDLDKDVALEVLEKLNHYFKNQQIREV